MHGVTVHSSFQEIFITRQVTLIKLGTRKIRCVCPKLDLFHVTRPNLNGKHQQNGNLPTASDLMEKTVESSF